MFGCSGHGAAPSGQPQAIGRVAPDELKHGAYQFDSRATPAGTSQPLRLSPSILRHLGYWTTDAPRFPAHTWTRTPTGFDAGAIHHGLPRHLGADCRGRRQAVIR